MKQTGVNMVWVVVKDLKQAIEFYTKVLGFKLDNESPEYGWAELSSTQGTSIGLAAENDSCEIKAGNNAVITVSVPDIEVAREELKSKGVTLYGEVMEVPGHVKLQNFNDSDGNSFQLVQTLY